jgi:hypothetical protein
MIVKLIVVHGVAVNRAIGMDMGDDVGFCGGAGRVMRRMLVVNVVEFTGFSFGRGDE